MSYSRNESSDKLVELGNNLIKNKIDIQEELKSLLSLNGAIPTEELEDWNSKVEALQKIVLKFNLMEEALEDMGAYLVNNNGVEFTRLNFYTNGMF